MSVRKPQPMAREIVLEKKAWFLCKFLSRTLDEDIYERIRYHISVCKGVKTKIKLSSKGLSSGYKTGSFRHLNHKLPYEFFPLDFVESLQQDIMFVNVLLGVFRMQSVPDLQYEIVAYKFTDNTAVKQMQDAFHMLTGSEPVQTLRGHTGSTMTLVPAGRASYQASTLQQQPRDDRWETRDRLGAAESVLNSEARTHNAGRREISGRRMILDSEGSWSEGSSIIEDSGTVFRTADGTVVAPSAGSTYGRHRNNITLTSVDSYDVPSTRGRYDVVDSVNHKIYSRPPSERGRGYDQPPAQSTRYQSNDTGSYYGRSRSVEQSRGYDTYGSRGDYTNGSRGYDTYASRGEDAYGSRGDYTYGSRGTGAVTPRNGYWTSDNKSDVISVKSQSSYLLSPKFKKVYAPRSAPQGGQGAYAASTVQSVRPRAYAGSEIRRDGRW